jgi:hypothetical protein
MFYVASVLFAAVSATKIVLSLHCPTHTAALAPFMSPFFTTAVFVLGFTVGAVLR